MSRYRYLRCVLMVTVGLLTLTAAVSPHAEINRDTTNAASNIGNSPDRRVGSHIDTAAQQAQLSEYQAPCQRKQYNGRSDLCAQWYAALAAGEAAQWSRWALVLGAISSVISIGGLAALLITIRQGREANAISREGLRPWMIIDAANFEPVTLSLMRSGEDTFPIFWLKFEVVYKNIGNRPTTHCLLETTQIADGFEVMMRYRLGETSQLVGVDCVAPNETRSEKIEMWSKAPPDPSTIKLGIALRYRPGANADNTCETRQMWEIGVPVSYDHQPGPLDPAAMLPMAEYAVQARLTRTVKMT